MGVVFQNILVKNIGYEAREDSGLLKRYHLQKKIASNITILLINTK